MDHETLTTTAGVYARYGCRLRGRALAAFGEALGRGYLVIPPTLNAGMEGLLVNAWARHCHREGRAFVIVRRTPKRAFVELQMDHRTRLSGPGQALLRRMMSGARSFHKRRACAGDDWGAAWVRAEDAEPLAAQLHDLALEYVADRRRAERNGVSEGGQR
jgi:hypothetical protein